ncbi:TSUP family transporter [Streptomyces caelestis]|uniref:TSUP family transporter n=1 Tax=Streptomyces TaxID=1883 RepID=UPI00099D9EE5|nr:TSUP family transporter [Streptomyces sp. XY152]
MRKACFLATPPGTRRGGRDTGLPGAGGGFLAVPALVTALACETRAAVGTGPPVITAGSPASPATRPSAAVSLDRTVVGPFVAAALLGARDGERLAAKVSAPRPRRVLALLPPAVAAFMLADAVT